MSDCCNYFLVEIKNGSSWVPLPVMSKSIDEVNAFLGEYFAENGAKQYRIVQRSIEADRNKGRKTPKCC